MYFHKCRNSLALDKDSVVVNATEVALMSKILNHFQDKNMNILEYGEVEKIEQIIG